MRKNNLSMFLAYNAIVAAVYVATSLAIAPLAFSQFQFRFAEILTVLPFFSPGLAYGVALGCFITNMFSPFLLGDITIGFLGTVLTVIFVARGKNLFVATLWPVLFAIFPAMVVSFYEGLPFLITAAYIMSSEFAVTVVIGYPFYKLLSKNNYLVSRLSLIPATWGQ
ncbi:MAG: QueT transporter family protein [Clostridiales bacterium]|jgi:uncharacterized membrane protein|nr:QueT transporter family protein [Clostridiales bacterium]